MNSARTCGASASTNGRMLISVLTPPSPGDSLPQFPGEAGDDRGDGVQNQRHSGRRAKSLRNSPEISEKSIEKGPPDRAYGEGKVRGGRERSSVRVTSY